MNGTEWVVEAHGCSPARLADVLALQTIFSTIITELDLHPVGEAVWHQFPQPGGVTGMQMLAESHLTVHTFPEHGSCCFNLFCCTPRAPWNWQARLDVLLEATRVHVRVLSREYASAEASVPATTTGVLS